MRMCRNGSLYICMYVHVWKIHLYAITHTEEQQREAQGRHVDDAESPEKSGRKIVVSKEEWTPPSNHLYEDMPGEDELEEGEWMYIVYIYI